MSREARDIDHPAPHRAHVGRGALFFAVCGAPLAWFAMLNIGYIATSNPCFAEGGVRVHEPLAHYGLAYAATVVAYFACLAIAVAAVWLSWRLLKRARGEASSDRRMLEVGDGRTHFLAMWGLMTGIGFGTVILVNIVAILGLPACAG